MKARIVMIIMAVALIALPTMAQQDQWKTSSMQGSGSAYSSNVTAVGATSAASAATTTESYSPAKVGGPRRAGDFGKPTDTESDSESPIGDAVLPLSLMALAFCGVIYYRRRKALSR